MICYQKVIQEVRNKYKDKLFVPCEAGLGNRLYALYAGYFLSHLLNLQDKTIILWPTCPYYCDTVFHDLFCESNNLETWSMYTTPEEIVNKNKFRQQNDEDLFNEHKRPWLIERSKQWKNFFQDQKPLFNDLDFNTTKLKLGAAYNYPINVTWFMFQNEEEYSYPNFDKILNLD